MRSHHSKREGSSFERKRNTDRLRCQVPLNFIKLYRPLKVNKKTWLLSRCVVRTSRRGTTWRDTWLPTSVDDKYNFCSACNHTYIHFLRKCVFLWPKYGYLYFGGYIWHKYYTRLNTATISEADDTGDIFNFIWPSFFSHYHWGLQWNYGHWKSFWSNHWGLLQDLNPAITGVCSWTWTLQTSWLSCCALPPPSAPSRGCPAAVGTLFKNLWQIFSQNTPVVWLS